MNPLQDKLVCLVMTCNRAPYNERREAHQDTFEFFKSIGFSLVYLYGNSLEIKLEEKGENVYNLYVPITECYELLSPKMEYAFNFLKNSGCKGVLKVDDDLSVLDKKLAYQIMHQGMNQCDYMGITVGLFGEENPMPVNLTNYTINFFKTMQTVPKEKFYYFGGPFYWLSRAALEEVCKMGLIYFYEDASVGYAIYKSNNLKVLDFNSVSSGDLTCLSQTVFRIDT